MAAAAARAAETCPDETELRRWERARAAATAEDSAGAEATAAGAALWPGTMRVDSDADGLSSPPCLGGVGASAALAAALMSRTSDARAEALAKGRAEGRAEANLELPPPEEPAAE